MKWTFLLSNHIPFFFSYTLFSSFIACVFACSLLSTCSLLVAGSEPDTLNGQIFVEEDRSISDKAFLQWALQ